MPTPTRQLCALLHDGHVLTDADRRIPSYDEDGYTPLAVRAVTCGDPAAVLVAPQQQVLDDPVVRLDVFTPRGERVPGTWIPLEEVDEEAETLAALRAVLAVTDGSAAPPTRRPDWFRRTWYDEVETWVDERLGEHGRRRTGPVEPVKVWSLSAVVRVPCEPGPAVWLKASCPHFHAEPALTRMVSEMIPQHAPRLVAVETDRAWLLVEEIPAAAAEDDDDDDDEGDEGEVDVTPGLGRAAAEIAAAFHVRSLDHLAEIADAGVPERSLATTLRQFDDVLDHGVELGRLSVDELAAARATRAEVHAALEELAGLGIPDTLVHGDLHIGNVAHDADSLVIYDWSDAAVSHPFLDLVLLVERLPEQQRTEARAAYAEVWRAARPDADVDRALELAHLAKPVYQAITFEMIYRATEDASYWELSGVVARYLRALPETFGRRADASGGRGAALGRPSDG